MGACASMLSDAPPEGGEVSRLADTLVRLGAERRTVNDALRLFWRADKDGSGTLGLKEFAETFALRTRNAFLPRMISLFDVGGDGDIGALEFVMCMAQFHERSASAHVYFAWRLFDQDDSGSMTMEEFETIINNSMSYTGSNEGFSGGSHDHMGDRIVRAGRNGARVRVKGMRQIIKQADLDDNGVITIDEFKVLCANSSHIAAPAFELWSAVEAQSKPCWKLKEELKAKGKLEAVLEMLSPAARKALGVKRKTDVDRKDRRHGAARRTMGNNRRKPERKIPGDLAFMDSVKIKNEDALRAVSGSRASGARARENIEITANAVIDITIGIETIASTVGLAMIALAIILVVTAIITRSVANIDRMMDITDNRRRTRSRRTKVSAVVTAVTTCGTGETKCHRRINTNSSDHR